MSTTALLLIGLFALVILSSIHVQRLHWRIRDEALKRHEAEDLYERTEQARVEGEMHRLRADAELAAHRKAEEAHQQSEARYRALAARTYRLYHLSAALSEAVSVDAVAKVIVRRGREVVGAAAGSVALCLEGKTFETLHAEEYPAPVVEAWRRFPADFGLCTTAAFTTQRPVLVGSFAEWQTLYPRSASGAADGGFVSTASLPLLIDNKSIGVLSFYFTVPVNFDQDYQVLLTSVAHHAAQAIDRARLYEATQEARVGAEAASRSKDDFLSIVSHELRTPLTAILGWGAMLRDQAATPAQVQRATAAIVNNAGRQARLIDDLLEVSRIVAGRLSLDLHECDLSEIVRGAAEAMLPLVAQQEIALSVSDLPYVRVVADAQRLEQVFTNLLANAVKYTPTGGQIVVDAVVDDEIVRVRVADSGCGIDIDALPHVFERFHQGNRQQPARNAGGLGLGLFIVQRLVEAMDGHVEAASAGPGTGSVFTVTLPIAAVAALTGPTLADPAAALSINATS